MEFRTSRVKKETFTIILLMQILISLLAVVYYCYGELGLFDAYYEFIPGKHFISLLILCVGIIGLLSLYWFKEMNAIMENEKNYQLQAIKLIEMEEANDLLNSQKHDFLNNLQVIWGLTLINDREKVVSYIQKLTENLKSDKIVINEVKKEEHPYLYTLLINKLHKCKDINIDMELNLYDVKYLNLIDAIDIVNIFGNLIDNAIFEVKELPENLRKICVDVYKEEDNLIVEIFNKGPKIREDVLEKMFSKGFTTKGKEGSGIGLYNVKNIVDKYNGSIEVTSDEEYGTNFRINFKI